MPQDHKQAKMAEISRKSGVHRFAQVKPRQSAILREQSCYGPLALLNEFEASEHLGIKVGTLRFWRRRKEQRELPFVKIGALVRYRLQDLRRYLAKHTVKPRQPKSKQLL